MPSDTDTPTASSWDQLKQICLLPWCCRHTYLTPLDRSHDVMPSAFCIRSLQTDRLLLKVGDFLVRQAKGGVVLTNKTDEEIAVSLKFETKWVKFWICLIEYHKRHKIPIDEEGSVLRRAIKKADWQLNHEQIIKTKRLGSGAFGDVYKGILRSGLIEKKEVAIKTINGSISAEENEKLFQEAMLMKTLVHPNVILLIGVASNEEPVMIVMELAPGGAVLDAVQAKPGPSVYIRIKYCLGAALGLTYLSGKGIIHRDIAARNTLIGKNHTAKISDFGLSCLGAQKKEKTLKKVPVRYLAPETLQTRSYTTKTDVWTFGIYMWEVFHDGMTPYDEFPNTAAIRKFVLAGNRLNNESDKYPEYLWTLTQECWKQNGADRPTFEAIATTIDSQMEDYNEYSGPFWKVW
ncbi:protein tyrosine kinase [Necator americanus]|uniref:non-specific protein-tyrosine kinase n=1 Tax=Necator americanus TaxID=51031 RepID=W2SU25_NECAM|nr:protein tyrosine kinase [Necator americanus]ETN72202.1 protein tyrosine kinase [Necator americanus]